MLLDVAPMFPKELPVHDNNIWIYVLAAVIIACSVFVTIKLINKKKDEEK